MTGSDRFILVIGSVAVGYYRTREAAELVRQAHLDRGCCSAPEVLAVPWEATRYDDDGSGVAHDA